METLRRENNSVLDTLITNIICTQLLLLTKHMNIVIVGKSILSRPALVYLDLITTLQASYTSTLQMTT